MDRQEVKKLLVGRANLPDVQRAAAYYLSIRYSYSATGNLSLIHIFSCAAPASGTAPTFG